MNVEFGVWPVNECFIFMFWMYLIWVFWRRKRATTTTTTFTQFGNFNFVRAYARTRHLISTVCTNHRIIKDTLVFVFVCVYFGGDFSAGVNTIIIFANRAVSSFFSLEIHVDLISSWKSEKRTTHYVVFLSHSCCGVETKANRANPVCARRKILKKKHQRIRIRHIAKDQVSRLIRLMFSF